MRKSRHFGLAMAASGTSHKTYCGEYTLPESTNAAMTKNATWARRGRFLVERASTAIATNPIRNVAVAMVLSAFAGTAGTPSTLAAYQIEPKSTPRSELKE